MPAAVPVIKASRKSMSAPAWPGLVGRPRVTATAPATVIPVIKYARKSKSDPAWPNLSSGRKLGALGLPQITTPGAGYGGFAWPGFAQSQGFGNPAPGWSLPCGSTPKFRLKINAGSRTIKIDFLQPGVVTLGRPTLTLKANPAVGLNADIVLTGGAGSIWTTATATFTATSAGGVYAVLKNSAPYPAIAYFDNFSVT